MIEHLSGEQISQWMMGERSPQVEHHVAACAECRAQLDELESTLMQFRGAMRASGQTAAVPAWREPAPQSAWFSWPRMILAAALLLLMVSAPVYWSASSRRRAIQAQRAAAAQSDDALLLEQVNSEIARAVPEPMEPLVDLVTWNGTSDENRKAEKQ